MKRTFLLLTCCLATVFSSAACTQNQPQMADESPSTAIVPTTMQTTQAVPSEFLQPAAQQGRVDLLRYSSKDYTRSDQPTTNKPAYVYLPYGYDAKQKYDIIYLIHGWTGVAEDYFGRDSWPQMKRIFDHLIEKGLTRPFIAVSPTWDKDNRSKGWGESTQEAAVFSQEYINDLIPAVESRYSTYAESTDKAGILASRNHRAVGGFSLGAITTWHIFEQAYPYSRWYLPMSGDNWHIEMFGGQSRPRETAQFLADLVKASPYKDDFYVWYAVGDADSRYPQTGNQARAMMQLSSTFNSRNFSYHEKPGGRHDMYAVWEFVYNALPTFFPPQNALEIASFTRETPIEVVMNDPSFGTYGRLLFPTNRGYWSGNTLGDLQLTWYSHINADKTVEIVNHLKQQSTAGEQIFYPIYTESEMNADAAKRNTGLFFFRGQKNAPFAVCNAGGGFAYVGAMHDSFPHALELSKKGYNAFALIYRPGSQTAMEDLARALTYIADHAEQLGVSLEGYSLWGGSAGARMAAVLGNKTYLRQLTGRNNFPQAAAVVMQYTGYSAVSADDAPTYANVGTADGIANWRIMRDRLQSLSPLGRNTEFHVYDNLPHGFGLGQGTVAEGWLDGAVKFWETQRSTLNSVRGAKRDFRTALVHSLDGKKQNSLQPGLNIVNGQKIVQ